MDPCGLQQRLECTFYISIKPALLELSSENIKIHSEVADDTFLITLEKFRILCLVYNEDFLFPWEALSYEVNLEFVKK